MGIFIIEIITHETITTTTVAEWVLLECITVLETIHITVATETVCNEGVSPE